MRRSRFVLRARRVFYTGRMSPLVESSGWKLGLAIWAAGMIGVIPATFIMLPDLIAQRLHRPPRVPIWVGSLLSCAQAAVVMTLLVWAGVVLAPRVGLHAPAFAALVSGRSVASALRPQLLPGMFGGLLVAVIPWYFTSHGLIVELHSPRSLITAVLYGGITEEILMRWGVMTLLLWLGWRWLQNSPGMVSASAVWAAIVISAVIFGAGHLPSTRLLLGHLTAFAVVSVIGGGALFGIVAGWLYWRYGLESAILCHATAHVIAYIGYKLT